MKQKFLKAATGLLAALLVFQTPLLGSRVKAAPAETDDAVVLTAPEAAPEQAPLKLHFDSVPSAIVPTWRGAVDFSLGELQNGGVLAVRVKVSDPSRLAANSDRWANPLVIGLSTIGEDEAFTVGTQGGQGSPAEWKGPALVWSNVPLGALKANEWSTIYLPLSKQYCEVKGSLTPDANTQIKSAIIRPSITAGEAFDMEIAGFQILKRVQTICDYSNASGTPIYQDIYHNPGFEAETTDFFVGGSCLDMKWPAGDITAAQAPAIKIDNLASAWDFSQADSLTMAYKIGDASRLDRNLVPNGFRLMLSTKDSWVSFHQWKGVLGTIIPDTAQVVSGEWVLLTFPLDGITGQITPGSDLLKSIKSMMLQTAVTPGAPVTVRFDDIALTSLENLYPFTTALPMDKADAGYSIGTAPGPNPNPDPDPEPDPDPQPEPTPGPTDENTLYGFDMAPISCTTWHGDTNAFAVTPTGKEDNPGCLVYNRENTQTTEASFITDWLAQVQPFDATRAMETGKFSLMVYLNDPDRVVVNDDVMLRIMLGSDGRENWTKNMMWWNVSTKDLKPNEWNKVELPISAAGGNIGKYTAVNFVGIQMQLKKSDKPFLAKFDLLRAEGEPVAPMAQNVIVDFHRGMPVWGEFSIDTEVTATNDPLKSSLKMYDANGTAFGEDHQWGGHIRRANLGALRYLDGKFMFNLWSDDFARINKASNIFAIRVCLTSTGNNPIWNHNDHCLIWSVPELPAMKNNQWNVLEGDTYSADFTSFGVLDYANVNNMLLQTIYTDGAEPITVRFDDMTFEVLEPEIHEVSADHTLGMTNDGSGGTAAGEGLGWNDADNGQGWHGVAPDADSIVTTRPDPSDTAVVVMDNLAAASVTLTISGNEAAEVVAAVYDAGGMMLTTGDVQVTENAGTVTIVLDAYARENADLVKVFFLSYDDVGAPVHHVITFAAGAVGVAKVLL